MYLKDRPAFNTSHSFRLYSEAKIIILKEFSGPYTAFVYIIDLIDRYQVTRNATLNNCLVPEIEAEVGAANVAARTE